MPRETGRTGFKAHLVEKLERLFPGSVVFNLDPHYTHQGIPDLLILHKGKWAMLETKAATNSKLQPNQEYWVDFYDALSFAAFIYPENEEEVLYGLEKTLEPRRASRLLKP